MLSGEETAGWKHSAQPIGCEPVACTLRVLVGGLCMCGEKMQRLGSKNQRILLLNRRMQSKILACLHSHLIILLYIPLLGHNSPCHKTHTLHITLVWFEAPDTHDSFSSFLCLVLASSVIPFYAPAWAGCPFHPSGLPAPFLECIVSYFKSKPRMKSQHRLHRQHIAHCKQFPSQFMQYKIPHGDLPGLQNESSENV